MTNIEVRDQVGLALMALEKANFLVGEWINNYAFAEKPDIEAARQLMSEVPGEEANKLALNSTKWYSDYDKIVKLVEMAGDYIYEAKEALEKAQ